MSYYALFKRHEGVLYRLDTRVYLGESDHPRDGDRCIAAIVGKNPGSAAPLEYDRLAKLELGHDNFLPYVRKRFINAYIRAGMPAPQGAYIRVWNLFYICNAALSEALVAHREINDSLVCPTERDVPRIIWFAWGPADPLLDPLKTRFLDREYERPFFYHIDRKDIEPGTPLCTSRVKHPQGMRAEPIESYLAGLFG